MTFALQLQLQLHFLHYCSALRIFRKIVIHYSSALQVVHYINALLTDTMRVLKLHRRYDADKIFLSSYKNQRFSIGDT